MAKLVPLTQGRFTIVSDEDYERVMRYRWCAAKKSNGKFEAIRNDRSRLLKSTMRLHRFIMDAPDDLLVDHWNNDSLDNRRNNLRIATDAENSRNASIWFSKKVPYKGVSQRENGKWRARIRYKGKLYLLGEFDNIIDAAIAYDNAARYYYGKFAWVNFPTDDELQARQPEPITNNRNEIPVSNKYVALVDEDDWFSFACYRWHYIISDGKVYARRGEHGKKFYLHREVMGVSRRDFVVHHINGNSLDNRKDNLQVMTPEEHTRITMAGWGRR